MTTVVAKGTNRPAATARRNRHAQTNPLPPRPAEAAAAAASGYQAMGLEALKEAARDLRIKPLPRTKSALLTALLEAERATAGQLQAQRAQAEQDEISQDDDAPSGAFTPDVTAEPKGAAKAARLAADVQPFGWAVEISPTEGGVVRLIARRGAEILEVTWVNGSCSYEGLAYVVGDRVVKPRNANAARQLAARSPEAATAELAKVGANRAWKRNVAAPAAPAPGRLPFDPETTDESGLWSSLRGRKVTWFNRHSTATEVARVSEDPRWFSVAGEGADRVIQFCSKDGGFRACRLAAITRIGR